MDFFKEVLQIAFLVLLFFRLTDCYSIKCVGNVTVDKDPVPMGSNLTVHCKSDTEQCNRLFIIMLNKEIVLQESSCSSVTTQLVVSQPTFRLLCMVKQGEISHLVCGRDIVVDLIPSAPHITDIVFTKGSLSATIHWQSSDNMEFLKPNLMFRRTSGSPDWMKGNVIQLHKGKLLMLDALEPLTCYEFVLNVCSISVELNCSVWSQPVIQNTPGQAPLNKLDVWRVIMRNEGSDTQNVTVLWKALTSEDYKGDLLGYKLAYKENSTTHTLNCSAATTQYTLQLHREVMEVNVSAVTSAGNSPPAPTRLMCAETPVPALYLSQTAEGRIHLAWNSSHLSYINIAEQMLGFVVQWQRSPSEVQWKRIAKEKNSTFIDETPPCAVNISLYVESIKGVSCPVHGRIHLKDKKSIPGPEHKDNKISGWVNTDTFVSTRSPPADVPGDYSCIGRAPDVFTAYLNLLVTSRPGQCVLSGASTLIYGSQRPEQCISSDVEFHDSSFSEGAVIGICVMAVVPIVILINLLYLKCARKRLRKTCMSVGPAWLFQTLPKLGNSNAIKLLQNEKCGSDMCWQSVDSDPPLSPVEDCSPPLDRRDSYPITHSEDTTEERKPEQNWAVCPYKPQISVVSQRVESVSDAADTEEEEHPWPVFSPGFDKFDEFLASEELHGPLKSCLTVDGTPVSVDVVDGFFFITQSALEEDLWRVAGNGAFAVTGNGDENSCQGQTVLPNDFVRCSREPSCNVKPHVTQGELAQS